MTALALDVDLPEVGGDDVLTARDVATVVAIAVLTDLRGYAPSLRDLGKALGLHWNSAAKRVHRLEVQGLASHSPNASRTLVLTTAGERLVPVANGSERTAPRVAVAS